MARNLTYDVAIVGYGPVGAVFANLLSVYGLRVAVFEQAAAVYDKPRAITIDHEVLRVFQACGLAAFMEGHIAPHPGTHYLGIEGEVIKIFDPMPPPYPLGWVPTATFVQPDTEKALRDRLAQYASADVFLSARMTSFAQDAEGVTLSVASDSAPPTIRATYLVACDGANSLARKQLGIALDDLAFDEQWMVVDAWTNDQAKRPNKCFQYCRPSRPGTYLPGPGALRRWEIKLLAGEGPQDFADDGSILKVLGEFTDTNDLTLWRSAVYRFHALLAREWRRDRVLLMGDAAHQMPPFLGQGFAAGVRDAVNLAWKLAMVLRGQASSDLLDTYEVERKPHVGTIVQTAKDFGTIIGELDVAAAQARDCRLRKELQAGTAETVRQKFIPNLEAGVIARATPLAGELLVQPFVRLRDGGSGRLDDLLKRGFVIAATELAPLEQLSEKSERLWRHLDGDKAVIARKPVAASGAVKSFVETDDLFAGWLTARGVIAVVVRPDRYAFGAARNVDELNTLIAELGTMLGVAPAEK